jgi:hypothetical protein
METQVKAKSTTNVTKLQFNHWAKKYKVSSLWFADTPEKRNLIERIQLAKYAQAMGMTETPTLL